MWPKGSAVGTRSDDSSKEAGPSWVRVAAEFDADPWRDLVADPDLLLADPCCEIVKDQRKIKVGRIPVELGGERRRIYVKRYNVFSLRYRFFSLFLRSGAARAWRGAEMLGRAGFQTGRPIGAVEWRRWGMLTRSFYLSEEIPNGKTADAHWRELMAVKGSEGYRRRRAFLCRLARLFRGLHQARLYHNDLKDANIIVRPGLNGPEESFYLLDLEGVRSLGSLSRRRQIKNLVQLYRTMGRSLRRTDKLYWLKVYLDKGYCNRERKRWWIGTILEAGARGDWRSQRRRQPSFAGSRRFS